VIANDCRKVIGIEWEGKLKDSGRDLLVQEVGSKFIILD